MVPLIKNNFLLYNAVQRFSLMQNLVCENLFKIVKTPKGNKMADLSGANFRRFDAVEVFVTSLWSPKTLHNDDVLVKI